MTADAEALDHLVAEFLASFTTTHGRTADVRRIYALALPGAVIVQATSQPPDVCSLAQFVEPRVALLSGGTLVDFEEVEETAQTHVAGNVARRDSTYRKRGVRSGRPFTTHGVKLWQFVRMPDGWRVSALVWQDEPDEAA
jgi:hypothetical protein